MDKLWIAHWVEGGVVFGGIANLLAVSLGWERRQHYGVTTGYWLALAFGKWLFCFYMNSLDQLVLLYIL